MRQVIPKELVIEQNIYEMIYRKTEAFVKIV